MITAEYNVKLTETQVKILAILTQNVRLGSSSGTLDQELLDLCEKFSVFDATDLEDEISLMFSLVGKDEDIITVFNNENIIIEMSSEV